MQDKVRYRKEPSEAPGTYGQATLGDVPMLLSCRLCWAPIWASAGVGLAGHQDGEGRSRSRARPAAFLLSIAVAECVCYSVTLANEIILAKLS